MGRAFCCGIILAVVLSGCTVRLQMQAADEEARVSLNGVIDRVNQQEARLQRLEAGQEE